MVPAFNSTALVGLLLLFAGGDTEAGEGLLQMRVCRRSAYSVGEATTVLQFQIRNCSTPCWSSRSIMAGGTVASTQATEPPQKSREDDVKDSIPPRWVQCSWASPPSPRQPQGSYHRLYQVRVSPALGCSQLPDREHSTWKMELGASERPSAAGKEAAPSSTPTRISQDTV